mgnify:FL=1
MYVALEGIDTAGKSTQITALKRQYPNAVFTAEPSDATLREYILQRDLDERSEFLLFLADRSQHIHSHILPNLDKLIISDRSVVSGMAYAKNIDTEDIISYNRFATRDILPSCVIVLYLEKQELEKRLGSKKNDTIESRGIEYLLTVQDNMLKFCERLDISYISIEASLKQEEITQQIIHFIDKTEASK